MLKLNINDRSNGNVSMKYYMFIKSLSRREFYAEHFEILRYLSEGWRKVTHGKVSEVINFVNISFYRGSKSECIHSLGNNLRNNIKQTCPFVPFLIFFVPFFKKFTLFSFFVPVFTTKNTQP